MLRGFGGFRGAGFSQHCATKFPCFLQVGALTFFLGHCERVLHFIGREVQGRQKFGMHAVKWVAAKLQGDKTASFCRK